MIHRDTGVAPDEVYTAAEEFGEISLLHFKICWNFDGRSTVKEISTFPHAWFLCVNGGSMVTYLVLVCSHLASS